MTLRSRAFLAASSLVLAVAFSPASHAAAYIKFDGIDGEVTAAGHEGWIEIQSWSWGATQAGAGGATATGRAAGTATPPAGPGTLNMIKRVDKATPLLMQSLSRRQHSPIVILHVSAPEGAMRYMEYRLEDVLVSSVSPSRTGAGGAVPTESLSLNFTKITMSAAPVTAGAPARAQ